MARNLRRVGEQVRPFTTAADSRSSCGAPAVAAHLSECPRGVAADSTNNPDPYPVGRIFRGGLDRLPVVRVTLFSFSPSSDVSRGEVLSARMQDSVPRTRNRKQFL
jgi:hypothetical protein